MCTDVCFVKTKGEQQCLLLGIHHHKPQYFGCASSRKRGHGQMLGKTAIVKDLKPKGIELEPESKEEPGYKLI